MKQMVVIFRLSFHYNSFFRKFQCLIFSGRNKADVVLSGLQFLELHEVMNGTADVLDVDDELVIVSAANGFDLVAETFREVPGTLVVTVLEPVHVFSEQPRSDSADEGNEDTGEDPVLNVAGFLRSGIIMGIIPEVEFADGTVGQKAEGDADEAGNGMKSPDDPEAAPEAAFFVCVGINVVRHGGSPLLKLRFDKQNL